MLRPIKRNATTEKIRGNHIIIKQEKALLLIFFLWHCHARSNRTAPLVFLFFCTWHTDGTLVNTGIILACCGIMLAWL